MPRSQPDGGLRVDAAWGDPDGALSLVRVQVRGDVSDFTQARALGPKRRRGPAPRRGAPNDLVGLRRWFKRAGRWRCAVRGGPGTRLMHSPRVIVTRPAGEASRWVASLRTAGLEGAVLIVIEPAANASRLLATWSTPARTWRSCSSVAMRSSISFSSNGAGTPYQCTVASGYCLIAERDSGHGTRHRRGHSRQGAEVAWTDAPSTCPQPMRRFDSEALWEAVRPCAGCSRGTRVLIVRGSDDSDSVQAHECGAGRDWLAEHQIRAAGGTG